MPPHAEARRVGPAADLPPGTTFDEWGIGHWAGGAEDTYERMFPPLTGELDEARIRDLAEPTIVAGDTAARVAAFHERGYPVAGYAGSIYEWSWWLRGMEQFLVDLLERPDLAEALVAKVAGFTTRLALASAGAGIDLLCFYDDAGSRRACRSPRRCGGRSSSPRGNRCWTRCGGSIREACFFLHSCGDITPVVADVAEIGFHVLHPVQPECMDAPRSSNGSATGSCSAPPSAPSAPSRAEPPPRWRPRRPA